LGTAIRSSNRFGGHRATARSRVQVRAAIRTETGTILSAKQQPGRNRECQLFPGDITDIDMRGTLQQWIGVGIVRQLGICAEDGGIYVDLQFAPHVAKAPAALSL